MHKYIQPKHLILHRAYITVILQLLQGVGKYSQTSANEQLSVTNTKLQPGLGGISRKNTAFLTPISGYLWWAETFRKWTKTSYHGPYKLHEEFPPFKAK